MRNVITRTRTKKGFEYTDKTGRPVELSVRERVDTLAIPPAWDEVQINGSPNAKLQAIGRDTSGKKQYIYHQSHVKRQDLAKFDRITSFAAALPKMRRQVEKDIKRRRFDKRKVLACAVSLMDEAYFRVGNDAYAKKNKSYGLTTLRSKHVHIDDDRVVFDFIGKSGQEQHKVVNDSQIAAVIKKLDEMPGYELFRYYDAAGLLHDLTSNDVNQYIKETMGHDYSAKDFRTWGGTLVAAIELSKLERPHTQVERKKMMADCAKRVARKLGNTPTIARKSYIDPRIFAMFEKSNQIAEVYKTVTKIKRSSRLSSDEHCAVTLLSPK